MLAEDILQEGLHHRTLVDKIRGGLDDRIAHLSCQLADLQRQISGSIESTTAELSGTKLEFKAVCDDMDALEIDLQDEMTQRLDSFREEYLEEVVEAAPQPNEEQEHMRCKVAYVEHLPECNRQSLEKFAIRLGEERKHARAKLNEDVQDGHAGITAMEHRFAKAQLELRRRVGDTEIQLEAQKTAKTENIEALRHERHDFDLADASTFELQTLDHLSSDTRTLSTHEVPACPSGCQRNCYIGVADGYLCVGRRFCAGHLDGSKSAPSPQSPS